MRLNDHGDDNGDDNGHILGSLPSHITTHRQDPKTWHLPPALTTFTSRSGRGHNPGDVLWQIFQTQPRFSGCVQKHGFAMSPQLQQKKSDDDDHNNNNHNHNNNNKYRFPIPGGVFYQSALKKKNLLYFSKPKLPCQV